MSADVAVMDRLVAAGVVTKGSTGFMGPVRRPNGAVPSKAMFALVTGGRAPIEFMDAASGSQKYSTVQVRVRGNAGQFQDGQTFARAAWTALHAQSLSGFISCLVRESEPVFLGFDENECPEWTLNVELISGG